MAAKPTTHEILQLNELIRMESTSLQKLQAMLPMIGDEELRGELSNTAQKGTTHLKALVAFCQTQGLTH